jgi:hypothetical protein
MIALLSAMTWFIVILPTRRRQLVIRGVPVIGRISDKNIYEDTQSKAYYLHYEYQPVERISSRDVSHGTANTGPFINRQSVRESDWNEANVGDSYTILYNPQQPDTSIIYQYGEYRVIG